MKEKTDPGRNEGLIYVKGGISYEQRKKDFSMIYVKMIGCAFRTEA